jgi:hypothetical protein
MDRPTIDLSRGIPKSPEGWEWREYADWLEAKVHSAQTLYSIGEVCRTGLEAECHRLEAEREQASQDYADLLKDYRELRKDAQAVVDNVTPWFSRTEEITDSNSPTNYDVDAKYIDNLKAALEKK